MNVQSEDGQYEMALSLLDCSHWAKHCNQCLSLCTTHHSHVFLDESHFQKRMTWQLSSGKITNLAFCLVLMVVFSTCRLQSMLAGT